MAVRKCAVTFTDHRGAQHTVEVFAETLYEAAALGLRGLRACEWVDSIGPASRLKVEALQPSSRHEVTVSNIERWAESTAVTPEDRMRKNRVRALLRNAG